MPRFIFIITFASSLFLWGTPVAAESSSAEQKGNFYYLLKPVLGSIVVPGTDGRLEITDQHLYFDEGDYFKVDQVNPDGSYLVKVEKTNAVEYVLINKDSPSPDLKSVPGLTKDHSKIDTEKSPTAKRLESGPGNYFRRLIGNKGLEDVRLYVDGQPGRRAALMAEPGVHTCKPEAGEKNPCVAWPSTGDALKMLDSTVKYDKDYGSSEMRPKLFYKVETTYCPGGPVNRCSEPIQKKVGWIEAQKVGPTKRDPPPETWARDDDAEATSPVAVASNKEKANCPDKMTQTAQQLKSLARAADVNFDEKYTWKLGACLLSEKGGPDQPLNKANLTKIRDQFFKEGPSRIEKQVIGSSARESNNNSDARAPSAEELFEMDVLARTLFGEMRSCSHNSPDYYKAVTRVLLNRVAIVKAEGYIAPFVQPNSPHAKKNQAEHIILSDVVAQPKQISSWNPDDSNLKVNLCPGWGRKDEEGGKAWKNAVRVAWEAVMERRKFLDETSAITHAHYTSGMTPGWAKGHKKAGEIITVDKIRTKSRCLILWRDQHNKIVEKMASAQPSQGG